jgi:TetR/AcrR family transcriptional regulator
MATEATETSRREQRRRRHQALSQEQLLDAAEEVFGRKGYHETTLKEVAELAEFSVGSVYSFFENKEDLFRQIFVRRGAEFMPGIRGVLEDPQGSPLEQLHRLVDFEVGWFRERPHFGRLYQRHANARVLSSDGNLEAAVLANYEESMRLQADLFARGQAAGAFRAGDPHVLARLFSGIMAAFQSADPAVVSDDGGAVERFPLADLHDFVEAAFRAPGR